MIINNIFSICMFLLIAFQSTMPNFGANTQTDNFQQVSFHIEGRIAFSDESFNLWVWDGETNKTSKITYDAESPNKDRYINYRSPKWSPDGNVLLFCKEEYRIKEKQAKFSLIVYDFDLRSLLYEIDTARCPADWSLDGSSLIYSKYKYAWIFSPTHAWDVSTGIWEFNLQDGSETLLIDKPSDGPLIEPRWSPDGEFIMFRLIMAPATEDMGLLYVWKKSSGEIFPAYQEDLVSRYYTDDPRAGTARWVAPNSIVFDDVFPFPYAGSSIYITDYKGVTTSVIKTIKDKSLSRPLISNNSVFISTDIWSSDISDSFFSKVEILIFQKDGENEVNLGPGSPIDWSPDDTMILFENECKIGILDIQSGNRFMITGSYCTGYYGSADWTGVDTDIPFEFPVVTEVNNPEQQDEILDNDIRIEINPIKQRIDPPVILNNGMKDYGIRDCTIAVMSMALDYFKRNGTLPENVITDYQSLIPIIRGTKSPSLNLSIDASYVLNLTGNKLDAINSAPKPDDLPMFLKEELLADRPILVAAYWNLLEASWPGNISHSVIVYGIDEKEIFYIDPWDGQSYSQKIDEFVKAATYFNSATDVYYSPITYFREQ